jgi:hypothetical protein
MKALLGAVGWPKRAAAQYFMATILPGQARFLAASRRPWQARSGFHAACCLQEKDRQRAAKRAKTEAKLKLSFGLEEEGEEEQCDQEEKAAEAKPAAEEGNADKVHHVCGLGPRASTSGGGHHAATL